MQEEKRENKEVPEAEYPNQETPEILKNLQDTFNFYFKPDKEQS